MGMRDSDYSELRGKYERAQDELRDLREAARALVTRLGEIDNHPSYQGVWGIAFAHGMLYDGPNWVEPMEALSALLPADAEPTPEAPAEVASDGGQ